MQKAHELSQPIWIVTQPAYATSRRAGRALGWREPRVRLLGLYFAANDLAELLDQMQAFAEDVVPRIG